MTEHEWLTTSDPRALLEWLLDASKGWMPSDRQLRLTLASEGGKVGQSNNSAEILQGLLGLLRGISQGMAAIEDIRQR